nr:hypothetical protein [uncultured Enterococcus sp.]
MSVGRLFPVGKMEKNQPDLENMIMLSELYKISLDELLKGEAV